MSIDLSTSYGGLKLKNPIVIGSSNIGDNLANLVKLEQAGAAAIVYKSLFEEQIELESFLGTQKMGAPAKHAGPAEHLHQLKEAKRTLNIPLIGSLNCIHDETWVQFAQEMESTGIDGLELNFYAHHNNFETESASIESSQIETLKRVRNAVKIPLFVKLSPFYSNILRLISQMDNVGVDGFVLFNRLFQPDIEVEKEEHYYPYNFGSQNDNRLALRYAGLLYKQISGGTIANTGIMTAQDVIKMLLAGSDAVQVVSCIYKKGINYIETMVTELESWMKKHDYSTLGSFKGKLSRNNLSDPFAYKRAQYVDILMKSHVLMQYRAKWGELPTRRDEDI